MHISSSPSVVTDRDLYSNPHPLTHLTVWPPGGGGGGLIGLAPLFHLTEQKGSRLCQTASQRGKRELASGAYVGSASTGRYRRGQALNSFHHLSQQSLESELTW